jgi:tRNA-Thr(GGU) m(6)t(6)A37 methyltransferase TsaA
VDAPFAPALDDVEGFERVWLIYWMDRAAAFHPRVVPYRDTHERGLFATRAPSRPNLIGMSAVRLLAREGNVLRVADVDILDGTPLLDIKPYVPEFDAHPFSKAGWLDESAVDRRTADDRFDATDPTSRTSIAARIVNHLLDAARDVRVSDVRIGLGYTAVSLADGRTGLAFTFRNEAQGCCSIWNGARPLHGAATADLLPLLESQDPIEAAVGLACANALANQDRPGLVEGEVVDHLGLRPDDDVAMVGEFGPLIAPIRERAHSLTILEQRDEPSAALHAQTDAPALLRRSHVAIITATSIINHAVDGLLEAARGCREVALLGASTPLLEEAFESANVTMLSGVVVREPSEVLRVVSEGGGARQLGPHVRKVSCRLRTSPQRAAVALDHQLAAKDEARGARGPGA